MKIVIIDMNGGQDKGAVQHLHSGPGDHPFGVMVLFCAGFSA
ncbi:hypothetical protein [Arachidicoccus ginsenosidivorans]|jgi:hypothetical protein|nr:hypothetical protein [Arachidicoccus ginsenosidivorans]